MWRACRVAALRRLKSESGRLAVVGARATARPLGLQQLGSANWFTSIAGVDRELLLSRSALELQEQLGGAQIGKVAKALNQELEEAKAREDVTSNEIIDLFTAAQKTRATSVMLDAFEFLDANFPARINFSVYGEIFRVLLRKKDTARMIRIYEESKQRFEAVPEMIYRFGIVGSLEQHNLEEATNIWEEMASAGHETPNEITSRLMVAFAHEGNVEKVQELYEAVDPQNGQWHEASIDRVILSMGIIKQPDKAFEFYSNSSMKLNGGTLMALLSVCYNNNCKQQASDILANRKKFDLLLNARGYNRILMTLEFLDRREEIKDVLEEMHDNSVRYDTMTRNIIQRNAEYLKETSFAPSDRKAAKFTMSPRIRELLANDSIDEAVAFVDKISKPVEQSDLPEGYEGPIPEGAMIVSPSVSRDAVHTYILAGQDDKLEALLKGFSVVHGNYNYALTEIIGHYSKVQSKFGDEISYHASKAMLFQGSQLFRVDDSLRLFRRFHDTEATLELFDQVLDDFSGGNTSKVSSQDENSDDEQEVEEEEMEADSEPVPLENRRRGRRHLNVNVGKVINYVLQTLVENGQLGQVFETIDDLEKHGLYATQFSYVRVLSSMRNYLASYREKAGKSHSDVVYDASSYQDVMQDMKQRGVKVSKAIVGNLCPGYADGDKQQRLELVEAYTEAQNDLDDNYKMPIRCYETLLAAMSQEGDLEDVKRLYEAAVASLDQKDLQVPRNWVTILISKLGKEGHVLEAEQLAMQMPELCGGYTYGALMAVMRAAMGTKDEEVLDRMLALFEEREFKLALRNANDLVHLARESQLGLKAVEIIRLFEESNLKDVPAAEDGEGNLKAAFFRHNRRDIHEFRKVKTMYVLALTMCEKQGLWKQALALRERMTLLLGQEAVDELTAKQNTAKKNWERKQQKLAHEEAEASEDERE
ncbi:hypothetical protein BBJ28_00012576 [Nothophytophthora sp. Chile5]|nr:hypothetical protein BBJ28_00012576 [Nothophytophthora sp. Chile5]